MARNYYINGNAVRELEAPERSNQKSREELEEIKRRKRRKNAVRRNRARALGMNRAYVAFLTMCVLAVAAASVRLVQLQSGVSARMRRVAALESEVNDQKAENDARYKSLMTSVDLNEIKSIAINELGMSYPSEEQIVYYTIENSNFMDQYSDIPK